MFSSGDEVSAGRGGNQGYLRRRWLEGPPPRHLQDEALSATPQEAARDSMVPVTLCRSFDCPGCPRPRTSPAPGLARRQRRSINNLRAEKNRLHTAYLDRPTDANKAVFYQCRRLAQQRLREIRDHWMALMVGGIQSYANRDESMNFFAAIKAIYDSPIKGNSPRLSSNGSMLPTEKSQILKR
ncbi:hypothetical protein SprV_0301171500 [Sparganum proliferum]